MRELAVPTLSANLSGVRKKTCHLTNLRTFASIIFSTLLPSLSFSFTFFFLVLHRFYLRFHLDIGGDILLFHLRQLFALREKVHGKFGDVVQGLETVSIPSPCRAKDTLKESSRLASKTFFVILNPQKSTDKQKLDREFVAPISVAL